MSDTASGSTPPEPVFTACDLPDRRRLYVFLDRLLTWRGLPLRWVPNERRTRLLDEAAPDPKVATSGTDYEAIWRLMYAEAALLVRHDDILNWNKFNNMILVNGALIAGFGAAVQFKVTALLYILPFLGFILSWLFDFTLQEGMRCLRVHKQKLTALERKVLINGQEFLFLGNPYNHRDALESGPLLLALFWFGISVSVWAGWVP